MSSSELRLFLETGRIEGFQKRRKNTALYVSSEHTDMSKPEIMPVNGEVPNITAAQDFFSSVPDGCFNLLCSFMTDLEDYKSLHVVIHKNKQCEPHWLKNLRKYAHRAEPLFDEFTSLEDLRFVLFDRKIDVRGWELHLIAKNDHDGKGKGEHKYMTHGDSFRKVCEEGDVDVVKAMVERTQVDLEARGEYGMTPLHDAAIEGHLPVVQYLCEQGADKEARDDGGRTPLHSAAQRDKEDVVQYLEAVKQCGSCGKACALKCSLCQTAFYCNAECQKKAWKAHKKQCMGYKKKEKK